MYTAKTSELAKLRAYRQELDQLYAAALTRRDLPRARELRELRRRVHRAVLLCEEWNGERPGSGRPAADRPAPAAS